MANRTRSKKRNTKRKSKKMYIQIGGGNKFNSKNIDKLSNAFNGAFNKLSKDDKTEIEQICKNFQNLICIQQPSSNIGGLRKKKLYKTIKLKNKRKSKRKGKK